VAKWIEIRKSLINMDKIFLIDLVEEHGKWIFTFYLENAELADIKHEFYNEEEAMKLYDFFAEKLLGKNNG